MTDGTVTAVDLFCGAGGFGEAAQQACDALDRELRIAGINHWDPAVETYQANHPDAVVYNSKVEQLDPLSVVADLAGREDRTEAHDVTVDLLVAGPECTHFSGARGGKPVSEQKRMSAWTVLEWVEKLGVKGFIVENVPEIRSWGPVEDGQPTRNGEVFRAWVTCLNKLGYSVAWTTLTAADYGDPTTRERFFLIGRRDGGVSFPDPTHSADPGSDDDRRPWRTAADVIDWDDLGGSIWTRDLGEPGVTPLANSTMERIAEGIRRHCDDRLAAFADVLADVGPETVRTLREERVVAPGDAATVAAAVDQPFLVPVPPRATGSQSVLLRQQDGAHPVAVGDRPVPTIATRGAHAVATVETLVMPRNGPARGLHSNPLYPPEERPLHTVTAQNLDGYRVTPTLVRYSHGGAALSVDDPMPTIATERGGVFALSTPQVRPFLVDYHGQSASRGVDRPLGAVERRDRFALCVPDLWPWGLDVRFRMLKPLELKRAQGFPDDYDLRGSKTDRTEQIGNAVPVNLGRALVAQLLTDGQPDLGAFGGGLRADTDHEVPPYREVVGDGADAGSQEVPADD